MSLLSSTGAWALLFMLAGGADPGLAAERFRHGELNAGQCAQLGETRLCVNDTYWTTLTVAGREIDFTAGGKVADGIPGQSVAYEIARDGNQYRVKVENWSTATVDFARYSEIRFRKQGRRFELTGYTAKDIDTHCERGVSNSADLDLVKGRLEGKVDGKLLFVAPRIPEKLRTPDLFGFKEELLYKPYRLYNGLAEATKKYCGNPNG